MGADAARRLRIEPHSMSRQFAKNYLIISIIPLLILLILVVVGTTITRSYLTDLIVKSTSDLNGDAEHSMQQLGERMIQSKARDVARQIEIFFRMTPDGTIAEMRDDPLFMDLAIQKVGETGYTAITETGSYMFRVHPNEKLNDTDMRDLADKLPSWWKIVEASNAGVEVSGYYDWLEADGSIRKKFMAFSPIGIPHQGKTLMVAATTYIDEFSVPIHNMRERADDIVAHYQSYVTRQWNIFIIIAVAGLLLTFAGVYFFGRKAALRYIYPIIQLSESAKEFGEGKWNVSVDPETIARKDEIGTLAQALNSMSVQLKDIFKRLENRVEELKTTQNALEESETHYRTLYEASQKAEEVYRSLIHSSADAIVTYDLNGLATYISPMFSQMFEWRPEELLGQRIPFVPESEKDITMKMIRDVIENGAPCQGFETKRITKSGREIDVSISASRYDDHEGTPAGMLVILRDISERKRMETQLQHVERMEAIGTLAGGVAHDFNNLLMVVQGSAGLLKQGLPDSDSNRKMLDTIEKQVQRGSRLTSQLLGYARKGQYEVRPLNLNVIVKENTEVIRQTRKDIVIQYNLSDGIDTIEADIYQIEQVLMNLFVNASDAMPDGGTLRLGTRNISSDDMTGGPYHPKPGPYVMLRVEDNGIGMDRKTKERIFDPFFTTKEMGKGTGLGLSSVYGIVKSHGGYIDAESEVRRGTAFNIYLPASKQSTAVIKPKTQEATRGEGTILLVDDESLVLEVGAEMLRSLGYHVITADNGKTAIDLYEKHHGHIDLILLDMVMPDMGGGESFDLLRKVNPQAKIILSSGYSIDGKASEILNRGCKGFIQKPYTIEQLSAKIQSVL